MKSVAPGDYESLPALADPAAYICVIRDIDRDLYRLEAAHFPKELIDAIVAEGRRNFGIELVAVLQTEDLHASEAELHARHHARLSSEWLELDALQLEELRRSMLAIDAYPSFYLMRGNLSSARRSERRAGGDGARRPLVSHHAGYRVLDRRRRNRQTEKDTGANPPTPARQAIANWIDDQFTRNPIAVFAIIVLSALICFGMIRDRSFLSRGKVQPASVLVASPEAVAAPTEPRPTPVGTTFLVAQRAPAHSCPSRECRLVQLLPDRTQIWGLQAVEGSAVNGSTFWIAFRLQGTSFVPITFLEPLD